jgi:hypothetical protein
MHIARSVIFLNYLCCWWNYKFNFNKTQQIFSTGYGKRFSSMLIGGWGVFLLSKIDRI